MTPLWVAESIEEQGRLYWTKSDPK